MSELASVLYKKGLKYIDEAKYEKAIVYLLNAVKEDSSFFDAYLDLAYCYAMVGDFEEAEYHSNRALEIRENDVDALLILSFVYHKFGFFDDEIEILNKVLNIGVDRGTEAEIFLNLGNAYYEKNDSKRALAYYKKVLEIEPDNVEAYVNLGNAYFSIEEFKKSVESYLLALQYDPEDSNIYSNLGVAYIEMGEKEKAFKYLKASIRLDPYNESAHYNLGVLYTMEGNQDRAVEQYHRLLELKSEMAQSLLKIIELKNRFDADHLF